LTHGVVKFISPRNEISGYATEDSRGMESDCVSTTSTVLKPMFSRLHDILTSFSSIKRVQGIDGAMGKR